MISLAAPFEIRPGHLGMPDGPAAQHRRAAEFLHIAEAIDRLTAAAPGAWADFRAVKAMVALEWRRSLAPQGLGIRSWVLAGLIEEQRMTAMTGKRGRWRGLYGPSWFRFLRLTPEGRAEHFAERAALDEVAA